MAATWFERNFYTGERPRLLIASNYDELNDRIKSLPLEHRRLGWCTLTAAAQAYLPRREYPMQATCRITKGFFEPL
jgi:hypothetical protein